ncbi:hypothetical protein GQ53DRAFT_360589 [Thozetella sp. PMI_491]|nr:hypothetical protein GQ53DRAFT_360589 [Thozetella sp. PMI_491]
MKLSILITFTLAQLSVALPTAETRDSPPDVNNPAIRREKAISKNGQPFEIGHLETAVSAAGSIVVDSKKPFNISVWWPVGTNCDWIYTGPPVSTEAAISRYALCKDSGSIYEYILWFTNTEHYDYFFTDQSPDTYQCDTWQNSDHYIRYNSTLPTIVQIQGE